MCVCESVSVVKGQVTRVCQRREGQVTHCLTHGPARRSTVLRVWEKCDGEIFYTLRFSKKFEVTSFSYLRTEGFILLLLLMLLYFIISYFSVFLFVCSTGFFFFFFLSWRMLDKNARGRKYKIKKKNKKKHGKVSTLSNKTLHRTKCSNLITEIILPAFKHELMKEV